jgi:hypothetical protein
VSATLLGGIGVPKSCQAAVLYYNQPAEKVVNLVGLSKWNLVGP